MKNNISAKENKMSKNFAVCRILATSSSIFEHYVINEQAQNRTAVLAVRIEQRRVRFS